MTTTKSAAILAARSLSNLIRDFEVTEAMQLTSELATVRGWIMDELKRRNPVAFDRWLDEGWDESPRAYFIA